MKNADERTAVVTKTPGFCLGLQHWELTQGQNGHEFMKLPQLTHEEPDRKGCLFDRDPERAGEEFQEILRAFRTLQQQKASLEK